jgi:cell division protein FtsB
MRVTMLVLTLLILISQYQLWLGHGGIREVRHLHARRENLESQNAELVQRNLKLSAEVADLKQGLDAIEERSRSELGMVKEGEQFYQIVEKQ